MDKIILPDTNILILGLQGTKPYAGFLRILIEEKRLALSVICLAEFLSKATDEEEKVVSALFAAFPILNIDLAVAQTAALYRKKYLQNNRNLKLPDCLIAATAKVYRLTLATMDKKDYPMADIEVIDQF